MLRNLKAAVIRLKHERRKRAKVRELGLKDERV